MTDEVKVPDGCVFIGWAGCDNAGTYYYPEEPRPETSITYMGCNAAFGTAASLIMMPRMTAAPIFVDMSQMRDLTPVPAVEWVTVGDNSIVVCEGYLLLVTRTAEGFFAEARERDGEYRDHRGSIPDLPAAQAWAVEKARELAKQSKASGPNN